MLKEGLESKDKLLDSKDPFEDLSAYPRITCAGKDLTCGEPGFDHQAVARTPQRRKTTELLDSVLVTEISVATCDRIPDLVHLAKVVFDLLQE
jgi:hypothetical protein